jgi:hypothetical protein
MGQAPTQPGFYWATKQNSEGWRFIADVYGAAPYLRVRLYEWSSGVGVETTTPDDYVWGGPIAALGSTSNTGDGDPTEAETEIEIELQKLKNVIAWARMMTDVTTMRLRSPGTRLEQVERRMGIVHKSLMGQGVHEAEWNADMGMSSPTQALEAECAESNRRIADALDVLRDHSLHTLMRCEKVARILRGDDV